MAAYVTTFVGGSTGCPTDGPSDGMGTNVCFDHPVGVAVDSLGNVYAMDTTYTLRKITSAGLCMCL